MCANVVPVAAPRWGIMDNAGLWQTALQGGVRLGEFRFSTINHAAFAGAELRTARTLELIYVYNTIRIRVHRLTSVGVHEILTLGEVLLPYLTPDRFLDQATARAAFISDVYSSLPLTNYAPNLTAAGLLQAYIVCNVLGNTDALTDLPATYPNSVDSTLAVGNRDLNSAVILLKIIAGLKPPPASLPVALLATLCSSLAKKGTMSTKFVDKIQDSIESELGFTITLDADVCRSVWNYWKDQIDETNVEAVVTRWVAFIPVEAMRFRLIMQQMADEGLTAFVTVRTAVTTFNDFPWGIVESLFLDQAGRYAAAVTLVGNNQYFGYAHNLGDAAGTKYKDIAWVARELMMKLGGQPELRGSKTFTNKPGHRQTLDDLVDTYVTVKGANAVTVARASSTVLAPALNVGVAAQIIVPPGTV